MRRRAFPLSREGPPGRIQNSRIQNSESRNTWNTRNAIARVRAGTWLWSRRWASSVTKECPTMVLLQRLTISDLGGAGTTNLPMGASQIGSRAPLIKDACLRQREGVNSIDSARRMQLRGFTEQHAIQQAIAGHDGDVLFSVHRVSDGAHRNGSAQNRFPKASGRWRRRRRGSGDSNRPGKAGLQPSPEPRHRRASVRR